MAGEVHAALGTLHLALAKHFGGSSLNPSLKSNTTNVGVEGGQNVLGTTKSMTSKGVVLFAACGGGDGGYGVKGGVGDGVGGGTADDDIGDGDGEEPQNFISTTGTWLSGI